LIPGLRGNEPGFEPQRLELGFAKMNESNQQTHVTETPDVSHIKNVDVTHEVSDVSVPGIAKFVLALSILMVVSCFLMWALFRSFQSKATEPPPSPMALTEKERLPPEPRLQTAPGFAEELGKSAPAGKEKKVALAPAITAGAPAPKDPMWEIKVLREQWQDVLEHGPIDQNGKRYGMPIEKAKEEILKQGLPARRQAADGRKQ
jgi:hypothetical protein